MKLLIDLGNSACKWAMCDNGQLVHHGRSNLIDDLVSDIHKTLPVSPTEVWVGSVRSVEKNRVFSQSVKQQWPLQPTFVEAQKQGHGIHSTYSRPTDLGNDRWLAMIGAHALHSGPVLVVDVGTAATLDALDQDGHHLGGQILPGYNTMIESLNQSTDGVEAQRGTTQDHFFADSTQAGVTMGVLAAMGAWIDRAAEQLANCQEETVWCLLTGGDAGILGPHIRTEYELVPDLVLQGLSVVAGDIA